MFQFALEKGKSSSLFDTTPKWDFLIIGGGPAGFNAALYAKRKGLQVGLITSEVGGQLHNTSTVDNYLGIQWIEGKDLSNAFFDHINTLEVPILKDVHVLGIEKQGFDFLVSISDGKQLLTKTILLATGGAPRQLGIPGENKYANKGVSYCTTCDAPFFKGKHVVVAGGGNSAAEAVLDLVPWASQITVVHRSQWRADNILLEKHQSVPNLTVHLQTEIKEVLGDEFMTGLRVFHKDTQTEEIITADGLFIEIGTVPKSNLVKDFVAVNERGEVLVDENQSTSEPGIYAAGDVTHQPYKQIIIAAAEGAKAALAVNQYLIHQYKGA